MPHPLQDWFSPDNCVSYYVTSSLKGTLERHVDFDRIDAVISGFGVGHFSRPERVLAEFARVLVPKGRVALSWQMLAKAWHHIPFGHTVFAGPQAQVSFVCCSF